MRYAASWRAHDPKVAAMRDVQPIPPEVLSGGGYAMSGDDRPVEDYARG